MTRTIVTLCGSVRFRALFEEANEALTLAGQIVLSVGCFDHEWLHRPENKDTAINVDVLHKDKISMSHYIFVLNQDKYIGKSTRSEIAYAKSLGKRVVYLERTDTELP